MTSLAPAAARTRRRRPLARAGTALASTAALAAAAFVGAAPAHADEPAPFTSGVGHYQVEVLPLGGESRTAVNAVSAQYLGDGSDASHFGPLSVTVPNGATVKQAYVGAMLEALSPAETNAEPLSSIDVSVNGGAPQSLPVVDGGSGSTIENTTGFPAWMRYADATKLLQANGSGNYQIENTVSIYAGQFLIVVLEDPSYPLRAVQLTPFFSSLNSGENHLTLPVDAGYAYAPGAKLSVSSVATSLDYDWEHNQVSLAYAFDYPAGQQPTAEAFTTFTNPATGSTAEFYPVSGWANVSTGEVPSNAKSVTLWSSYANTAAAAAWYVTSVDVELAPPVLSVPADGSRVAITGAPGATVTVTGPNGEDLGTVTLDEQGKATLPLDPALAPGTTLTATQQKDDNTSDEARATVPQPLKLDDVTAGDEKVTGTGQPGATVTLTGDDGKPLGSATVGDDGTFEIGLDPAAKAGDTLTVTQTDATGNPTSSAEVEVAEADTEAPAVPNAKSPSNGKTVTGTGGEPGATVTVKDEDGNVLGTGTVGDDGSFAVSLEPNAADGAKLSVTQTDAAGNESAPTEVTVDAVAPAAPNAKSPSNGKTVTGTGGEPGAVVTVKDEDGNVLGTGTVGDDGSFAVTLEPNAADGAKLSVTQTDAAGNESEPTEVTVDAAAPAAPKPDTPKSGDKTVTGTGEPGATVRVLDEDGTVLGSATVGADGTFEVPLSRAVLGGEDLTVVQVDAAGNESGEAVVTVAFAQENGDEPGSASGDGTDDTSAPAGDTADPASDTSGPYVSTGGSLAAAPSSARGSTVALVAAILALLAAVGGAVSAARRQPTR